MSADYGKLDYIAEKIRYLTVDEIGTLGVGHIGGSLSISNVLSSLYFDAMNIDPENPDKDDRDRLVLSKGHGGPALYATLALKGYIPMEELKTLNQPDTNLPSHCDRTKTRGIDMTTGSLGQGFSAAVGMAVGAKYRKLPSYIYTIIGDGESQEGQIWEAAMYAGSHKLDNLIAFTDYNKMQIDGYVEEINGLYPLEDKWKAFGWNVYSVDGHSCREICLAIDKAKKIKNYPCMIILNTIKGKGCYFAENLLACHNMSITPEMKEKALQEISEVMKKEEEQ